MRLGGRTLVGFLIASVSASTAAIAESIVDSIGVLESLGKKSTVSEILSDCVLVT
jgi:hypothetical protein